jgi:hypothetical protein
MQADNEFSWPNARHLPDAIAQENQPDVNDDALMTTRRV